MENIKKALHSMLCPNQSYLSHDFSFTITHNHLFPTTLGLYKLIDSMSSPQKTSNYKYANISNFVKYFRFLYLDSLLYYLVFYIFYFFKNSMSFRRSGTIAFFEFSWFFLHLILIRYNYKGAAVEVPLFCRGFFICKPNERPSHNNFFRRGRALGEENLLINDPTLPPETLVNNIRFKTGPFFFYLYCFH